MYWLWLYFQLRTRLEDDLNQSLAEFRHFIDEEIVIIFRQMEAPSKIFDYLYLGSEWNASNLEELKNNGSVFALVFKVFFTLYT